MTTSVGISNLRLLVLIIIMITLTISFINFLQGQRYQQNHNYDDNLELLFYLRQVCGDLVPRLTYIGANYPKHKQ